MRKAKAQINRTADQRLCFVHRLIESKMELGRDKEISGKFSDFSSLIRGSPRMRLEESENEPETFLLRLQHHH